MAKGGKLTKLKSILKKWNFFSKQNIRCSLNFVVSAADDDYSTDVISGDLRPVYVGKSRRCYLVASNIVDHLFFKELANRSNDDTINVACEVVLLEHLLWML
ncbi:hypothetical protein ACFXTH_000886 [Malus domestica]